MSSVKPPKSIHPPGTSPECRARHLSVMLQMLETLPDVDRQAIQGKISGTALDAVRTSTALTWVPMRHNVEIVLAISQRLGPVRARQFFRSFQERAFKSAMMRNFIESAVRIAASNPATALRLIPAGYDLVFRNVGEWDAPQIYDECGVMVLRRIPNVCLQDAWLQSLAGSLHSVLTLLERVGEVDLHRIDRDHAKAELRFSWLPR